MPSAPILARDARARARRIRLLLFDVDGVLTDGTIWYFPLSAQRLVEVKGFSAHDGIGIMLARRAGLLTGVITKRVSQSLAARARDLKMDFVRQGIERKGEAFAEVLREAGVAAAEACCMGDDLVDLPMLRACGLAAAPANARPEVLALAHFVARRPGGAGAARDLIEFVLKTQGKWRAAARGYL
ncbi:MAG TPA: HAD hydrolase family protein [Terriglobales bacterium]|nr:HAD hydrolase family protein [Terriglobales bacterium]